jgi:hypothetical protein
MNHLFSVMEYEDLLALMYETAPQDVPEISYEVGGILSHSPTSLLARRQLLC